MFETVTFKRLKPVLYFEAEISSFETQARRVEGDGAGPGQRVCCPGPAPSVDPSTVSNLIVRAVEKETVLDPEAEQRIAECKDRKERAEILEEQLEYPSSR